MGPGNGRVDPSSHHRRRADDRRAFGPDLVAAGDRGRSRDLCRLCQSSEPSARAGRADRPYVGVLSAPPLRHPPPRHGQRPRLRARRQQAVRDSHHRRFDHPHSRAVGLCPGSARMSVGESSTPLGKVAGLGSAREGGEHWLTERVTSIALLLLGLWLVASLLFLPALDRATLVEWLRGASGAVPMALLIVVGFVHGLQGMKVIVDDYVHDEGNRFALNTLLLFAAIGGAAL